MEAGQTESIMSPIEAIENLVPQDVPLIIAVSGGIDSTVLLRLVLKARPAHRESITVAHLDHGLRPESAKDAVFVEDLSAELGVAFRSRRVESPSNGRNIEAWGRQVRYSYFKELRSEINGAVVLTAHTLDDRIETFFVRLLQGRVPRGISMVDSERGIHRPFFFTPKRDLYELSQREGWQHVEDESNESSEFLRNRVRHTLLPHLEGSFPEAAGRLTKSVLSTVAFVEDLELLCHSLVSHSVTHEWGTRAWCAELVALMDAHPQELQWHIAKAALFLELRSKYGRSECSRFIEVLRHQVVGCELPGGVQIRRSDGALVCTRA